jgi:prophage antirepressor-like protein
VALLVENQAWFCAHELGRLMSKYLDGRMLRKLDADQRQMMCVQAYGKAEERLMVSESGVYALLVYHYCPEYLQLREWLTHQVVPALRNVRPLRSVDRSSDVERSELAADVTQHVALAGRGICLACWRTIHSIGGNPGGLKLHDC